MISEMEKQHPFILIVFSSHSRILTSAFHDIFKKQRSFRILDLDDVVCL